MLPLEGNRWMVTIGGRHGDVPPGDEEAFLTYAKALGAPTIYNAIKSLGAFFLATGVPGSYARISLLEKEKPTVFLWPSSRRS